ncbi:hypothetical protein ANO11243_074710 [Dothideomycetidae sp. 11243]|nr:hypothetical protein ANO11243_074710 [fungal sp. No.11243]
MWQTSLPGGSVACDGRTAAPKVKHVEGSSESQVLEAKRFKDVCSRWRWKSSIAGLGAAATIAAAMFHLPPPTFHPTTARALSAPATLRARSPRSGPGLGVHACVPNQMIFLRYVASRTPEGKEGLFMPKRSIVPWIRYSMTQLSVPHALHLA